MYETTENITKKSSNKKSEKKLFRQNSTHSQIILQVISDTIAILLTFVLQYLLRFELGIFSTSVKPNLIIIGLAFLFILGYWLSLFFLSGTYKNWYERSPFDEMFSMIRINTIGSVFIVLFVFFDSVSPKVRLLFLFYFLAQSFFTVLGRFVVRRIQIRLRAKRIIQTPTIIIGNGSRAYDFARKTEIARNWGYLTLGIVVVDDTDIEEINALGRKFEILGHFSNLDEILNHYRPEEVIIATDKHDHERMLKIVEQCTDYNIRVKIEPDLYDIFTGQAKTHNLYGIPLIEIHTQLLKPWQEATKRIFDIVFSLVFLLLTLPISLIAALAIKLDSPGPIFFTQPRVGLDGRVFNVYKFRSMTHRKQKHEDWTQKNDPRVTKVGKFIRKTHIDEFPQFLNVLLGHMSVVGPRPEQPKLVEQFSQTVPHFKRRLKVRPGITGWWQVVYEPHQLTFDHIEEKLKKDFYYIENMSLQLDFEIIIRTVWRVIKGDGQA